MQWVSLLLSFFLGKFNVARPRGLSFKEGINFLFEEAAYRSRKPAMLALGALVSVTILCGGFFMGVLDLTSQYDRDGYVRSSAGSISGFAMVLIAIGVFTWIFRYAWPGVKEAKEVKEKETASSSGLEYALSLLVLDYIKERELKRNEHRQHQPVPTEAPEAPSSLYNN